MPGAIASDQPVRLGLTHSPNFDIRGLLRLISDTVSTLHAVN